MRDQFPGIEALADRKERGYAMSRAKKTILWLIFLALIYGLSCPWQRIAEPLYLGFLPAPVFYLILVHLGFVCLIAYLAYFSRLHGRAEEEKEHPSSLQKEVRP